MGGVVEVRNNLSRRIATIPAQDKELEKKDRHKGPHRVQLPHVIWHSWACVRVCGIAAMSFAIQRLRRFSSRHRKSAFNTARRVFWAILAAQIAAHREAEV
jgi:hypothetical protein